MEPFRAIFTFYYFLLIVFFLTILWFIIKNFSIVNDSLIYLPTTLFFIVITLLSIKILAHYERKYINIKSETSRILKEDEVLSNLNILTRFIIIITFVIIFTLYLIRRSTNEVIKNFLLTYLSSILGYLASYCGRAKNKGEKIIQIITNASMFFTTYHTIVYCMK